MASRMFVFLFTHLFICIVCVFEFCVCLSGAHQASVNQVDALQRELEQLRESNQAIQAEKSALLQQLADQEAVTRTVTDENVRQVGEVRRLQQLMQQRDQDNKQLQTAVHEQEHLADGNRKKQTNCRRKSQEWQVS